MNLRELVALLESGGKPVFSEVPVKVIDTSGQVYSIADVAFEGDLTQPDSYQATTWIRIEEQ